MRDNWLKSVWGLRFTGALNILIAYIAFNHTLDRWFIILLGFVWLISGLFDLYHAHQKIILNKLIAEIGDDDNTNDFNDFLNDYLKGLDTAFNSYEKDGYIDMHIIIGNKPNEKE